MKEIKQIPSYTAIRMWVLKFGLFKLSLPRKMASNWATVIDHTIQIGTVKVLIVLGFRLTDLPLGRALTRQDVEPLVVLPMMRSTGRDIDTVLTELQPRLGNIRLIVADEGSDIKAGIKMYRKSHAECEYVPDLIHILARFLNAELKDDSKWKELAKRASDARTRLLQSNQAYLIPPQRRDKARYLNLEELIRWACRVLRSLEGKLLPPQEQEQLEIEFGWIAGLKDHVIVLEELWQVTSISRDFIRKHGIESNTSERLTEVLEKVPLGIRACQFAGRIIDFVSLQAQKAHAGERLLGSSEILESLIGSLKHHLNTQSRSGFTVSCLLASTLAGDINERLVFQALSGTKVQNVNKWADEHIGSTIQKKRKDFYRRSKAEPTGVNENNNGTDIGKFIIEENLSSFVFS